MNRKILFLVSLAFSIAVACKQKPTVAPVVESAIEIIDEKKLPDLQAGEELFKTANPFGETILLTGKQIVIDTIVFKTNAAELIVNDNIITVKNRKIVSTKGEHVLMQFQLPDFNLLSLSGTYGAGPDEFIYPHLVPAVDTSIIAYVFEGINQKLYQLDKKGNLNRYPFSFTSVTHQGWGSNKQVINVGTDDFMYAETSATGKSIFRATQTGDSVIVREVFNLALNPKRKSWTNYIGDFAVNPKLNRMAYAYKYFKIIKFMDMEAQTVRTISFEREKFDESTNYKIDGMDQNVTHYWGVCAQPDHVYFLYSGRTPYDVVKEGGKKIYYIFVEKYDWNGKPIACYKLDHWGYFTVDEKNSKLYLMSTNDDDPFFVYDLP